MVALWRRRHARGREVVPSRPINEALLSADSRAVLEHGRAEAARLHHDYLGTEHILLGLMRVPGTQAARVLSTDIDLESVRAQIEQLIGVGRDVPSGELPVSQRAQQLLHFAGREADQYGSAQIEPEHLLIGILREGEGTAMQVIMTLGVEPGRVLAEIPPYWRHDRRRHRPWAE
jgi:ATP-dependent Clp protease ATP-binding subunit ClpC